ncbi:uncharacterized protein RSE6_05072 [Rhynchosporium secalis]|uniref:Uncharacterized protein n=1 Tax=Rhynchosporium secalis TaxID=38038 RepID=A0A1E1M6U7_RHYSE|nr:uncharacterized protein RSE6_05072 [Rhynchosporium secalis]
MTAVRLWTRLGSRPGGGDALRTFFFCLFALEPFGRSEDVSTIFSSSSTAFLIMTSSGVKKDWARFTYTFLSESSITRRPFGREWSKLEVVVWNGTYSGSIYVFFASSFPEGIWLAAFDILSIS